MMELPPISSAYIHEYYFHIELPVISFNILKHVLLSSIRHCQQHLLLDKLSFVLKQILSCLLT